MGMISRGQDDDIVDDGDDDDDDDDDADYGDDLDDISVLGESCDVVLGPLHGGSRGRFETAIFRRPSGFRAGSGADPGGFIILGFYFSLSAGRTRRWWSIGTFQVLGAKRRS